MSNIKSPNDEKYLTINQAAEYLGVSTKTIRRYVDKKLAKPKQGKNRQLLFSLDDVLSLKSKAPRKASLQKTYSVKQAAELLKVSPDTIRRWDREGKLTSVRTRGGHRRFSLTSLRHKESPGKGNAKKVQTPSKPIVAYPPPEVEPVLKLRDPMSASYQVPQMYKKLHGSQTRAIAIVGFTLLVALVLGIFSQAGFVKFIKSNYITYIAENISKGSKVIQSDVLQASTTVGNRIFRISVPTVFEEIVTFNQGFTSDELATFTDLDVTGALGVTGSLNIGSGFSVGGASTLASLALSDGSLLDLSGIIHDDSGSQGLLLPQNTSLTNLSSGEGYLAYDSDDNKLKIFTGSSWVNVDTDTDTITASLFTDAGAITHLASITDDFALGGTTSSSPFFFDVSTGILTATGGISGTIDPGFSVGSVLFIDANGIAQDNTNFTWDDATDILSIGSGGAINPTIDVGADLGSLSLRWNNLYVANINAGAALDISGQATFTYDPTDTTYPESTVLINPTTPEANELLLGIGVAGSERAGIDAEGNLVLGYNDAVTAPTSDNPLRIYNNGSSEIFTVDTTGAITASGIGKVIIVDGTTYAQTCTGINAAIDALPSTGGEVFLPEGTYSCDESITIDVNNTSIKGAGPGSIIEAAIWASWTTPGPIITGSTKDYTKLANFQIDGTNLSGGGLTHPIISLFRSDYVSITGLTIDSSDDEGILIFSLSDFFVFEGNTLRNTDGVAIVVDQSNRGSISSNIIEQTLTTGSGIQISQNSSHIAITGNSLFDTGTGIVIQSSSDNIISSNVLDDVNSRGIYLWQGSSTRNNIVDGNTLTVEAFRSGIVLSRGATDNIISNNNIYGQGGQSSTGLAIAFDTDDCSHRNILTGNIISGFSGTSSKGISISGAQCEDNVLSYNRLYDNTTDIADSGTGTQYTYAKQGLTNLGHSITDPINVLGVEGTSFYNNALFALNETSTQDIFTASASGVTKFTIQNDGDIDVYGSILGLNNDADVDNLIALSASAGQAGSDLYWGDDLLCDVSEASCGTGGLFTDAGAITHLTSTTDDIAFGGTTSSSPFFFDVGTGDLTVTGAFVGDTTDSVKLQAGGTVQGSTGTSSIFFLNSAGTTKGRFDAETEVIELGDGADGALDETGTFNLNTDISAGSGRSYADGIAYNVDPATATSSGNVIKLYDTPNGIVAGDELLLINIQGADGDTDDVGKYDFFHVVSVNATTKEITLGSIINKSYDGTTPANQRVIVQRVPNYTSVTLNTASDKLTASAWDGTATTPTGDTGYLTGIVAFRATGTVALSASTSIDVDALGYRGGTGGTTSATGGDNGESYDGTVGKGGDATGIGSDGGGDGNQSTSTFSSGTRTGGGGGGGSDHGASDHAAGGAGGGGYAGGGGGGGSGAVCTSSNSGNGGSGGAVGVGGGGGGGDGGGCTSGNGGNAGSAGGLGGAAGSGTTTGQGGDDASGRGGGGGGGGLIGTTGLTTLFYGGGGGGGGGNTVTAAAGANGSNGGGIIFLTASILSNSGTISSDGPNAVDSASDGGDSGGGAGGSIYVKANTITIGTTTASGGSTTSGASGAGGGGGGGGDGRVRLEYITSLAGSTTPAASSEQFGLNNYGTFYLGATNTSSADIAEHYPSLDSLVAGEVVSFDTGNDLHIKRSQREYEEGLIGVVSTSPGVILGQGEAENVASDSAKTYPVALSGRVPVKVSSTSESIKIGDYLTSSSEPGRAMRATKAGMVVGRALETWKPNSGKNHVKVFVETGYSVGTLTISGELYMGDVLVTNNIQIKNKESFISRLFKFNDTSQVQDATVSGEATSSGEIDDRSLLASSDYLISDALSELLSRIETVEGDVTLLQNQNLIDTDSSESNFNPLTSDQTVLGDTVINGNLDIGILSFNGLTASLNAIGTLNIQPLALGDVEFVGGNITIDQKGNLEIKKGVIVGNEKIRGAVALDAGQTQAEVEVSGKWGSLPISIVTNASYFTDVVIENLSEDGFVLRVRNASQQDEKIYWLAIW